MSERKMTCAVCIASGCPMGVFHDGCSDVFRAQVDMAKDEEIARLKATQAALLKIIWDAAQQLPDCAEAMIALADIAVGWTKENPVYAFGKPVSPPDPNAN